MHEELTDGTVTLIMIKLSHLFCLTTIAVTTEYLYCKKAGINGKAKIYIKPGGGYGKNGGKGTTRIYVYCDN